MVEDAARGIVLANERAQTLAITERPAWKVIQLGTHKSAQELRQALLENRFRISTWGDDILNKVKVAQEPGEVNLVLLTVADLGFPNGAEGSKIYEKALSLGLELCPAEVGPQLRLQYPDQPIGEWILVAMEPITHSGGDLEVFSVDHARAGRWLYGFYGRPDRFWRAGRRWVFCRK